MALTKKHEEIQYKKRLVIDDIKAVNERGAEAIKRVPKWVVNGSHEDVVAWKGLAEAAHSWKVPTQKYGTLAALKDLLSFRAGAVDRLCGAKPLR